VKLKNKNSDKLKEECGVFGILNNKDAAALTALGLHSLHIEDKKVVVLLHLMEKTFTLKEDLD